MRALILAVMVLTSACTPRIYLWPTGKSESESTPVLSESLAKTFCIDNGGTHLIQRNLSGQNIAYCVFDDRSACDEWTFYQGSCQPGDRPNFL